MTQVDYHTGTESQRQNCIHNTADHHTGTVRDRAVSITQADYLTQAQSETELYQSHRQIITQAQSEAELYPSHRQIITQAQSETELYPAHRRIITQAQSQRLSCIHHTGGSSHRHRESETELYP